MQFPQVVRLVYLLFFFFCISSFSQEINEKYDIQWHSADDNTLPQNSVKSIQKDSNGFIWLATENGLVRYDGANYLIFNNENIPKLKSNRMFYFQGNSQRDSIYIINDYFEYTLIHKGWATSISKNKVPKKYHIDDDEYKFRNVYPKKIPSNLGYYLIEEHAVSFRNFDHQKSWQIEYDASKSIFFVVDEKLFAIDDKATCIQFLNSGTVKSTFRSPEVKLHKLIVNTVTQQVFLKTGKDLLLFVFKDGKPQFQPVLEDYDLSKSNIVTGFFDTKSQILYLGSTTKGLLIVKKKNFKTLLGEDPDGAYYAQIPFSDTTFLTGRGLLFSAAGSSKKINIRDNDEYSILIDKKGNVWTKSYNILFCYFKETNYATFKKWIFSDRVTQLYETTEGKFYIGTSRGKRITKKGRIYLYDDLKKSFDPFMSLGFTPVFTVQSEPTVFWAASDMGFHRIDLVAKQVKNIEEFNNMQVRSLLIEGNLIWVTTYNKGFFLYNIVSKKVTKFPLDKNKYLASSHCIIKDDKGFFWISTNRGLFQVSRQALLDYSLGKNKDVYYHCYDKSDGFLNNEFNGGCQPCGVYLKNKLISFPSMEGNVVFNSDHIKSLLPNQSIYFEEAEIDNVVHSIPTDTLRLDPDFEKLRLFLRSPYYGNPNNLNIEVKLEGPVSQKWNVLHDNNITLNSLPPGIYKVVARKLSGFDSNYTYATKILVVPHKFWQTTLFKLLLSGLLVLLCYFFFGIRVKYLEKKNSMLEKKVSERTKELGEVITALNKTKTKLKVEIDNQKKLIATITHDIKSPLQFLALVGKEAYQKIQSLDAKEKKELSLEEDIEAMYTSSFQLYSFVDNLLDYTKFSSREIAPEICGLHTMVAEKIKMFENLAASKKIIIQNNVAPNFKVHTNKLLFSIIIHNLLDNAIKNTYIGEISFNAFMDSQSIVFMIKDSGRGMDADALQFYTNFFTAKGKIPDTFRIGMGFQMIEELLLILEGKIQIKSQADFGTEITIKFKNSNPDKP